LVRHGVACLPKTLRFAGVQNPHATILLIRLRVRPLEERDKCAQGRRGAMPAGMVEVETWKGLTPLLQYADERPAGDLGLDGRFRQAAKTRTGKYGIAKKAGASSRFAHVRASPTGEDRRPGPWNAPGCPGSPEGGRIRHKNRRNPALSAADAGSPTDKPCI